MAQWGRAFATQAEGLVFESQPRADQRVLRDHYKRMPIVTVGVTHYSTLTDQRS